MSIEQLYLGLSLLLLLALLAGLYRVFKGPSRYDRMLGGQLIASCGVATLLLLAVAGGNKVVLDVALVFTLLGTLVGVAFVRLESGR